MSSGRGFRPCMLIHVPPFSSGGPHQRVTWTYPLLIMIFNNKHWTISQFVLFIFKQTGNPMLLNTINYKHWTWLSYTDYSRCNNVAVAPRQNVNKHVSSIEIKAMLFRCFFMRLAIPQLYFFVHCFRRK